MKLSDSDTRYLFWDVDLEKLDYDKHSEYVIARVLEKGNLKTVKQLFKYYSKQRITDVIISTKQISPRTAIYWQNIFNITEPIACLETNYRNTRKMHWQN